MTGDAESTDNHEWISFTTNLTWSLFPNSSSPSTATRAMTRTTPATAACSSGRDRRLRRPPRCGDPGSGPPAGANATTLVTPTGPNYTTGASSILCESDQQLNKTGTLMLASPEPQTLAPQSVTVAMKGAGFQGLFLGVLL